MRVSGATFVRDAVRFDYPVKESITSVLPLCDEFIVNVGDSEDRTLEIIQSIPSEKIRIIKSTWDDALRTGGRILSRQTDIALKECRGDWIFYIQADEVLHERYLDTLQRRMEICLDLNEIEGLLFDFSHFYGSYFLTKDERGWYRKEIRIIRNHRGITSWKDAQGFRLNGRKLRVVKAGAEIYHYGWARDPEIMLSKQKNLDRFWHDDSWIDERYKRGMPIPVMGVAPFTATHPSVMDRRIDLATWDRYRDPALRSRLKRPLLRRLASVFDRFGEYRNYVPLDEDGLRAGTK
ncbi:MAG: glycosyltransferase [Candidatus Eisenbacteria bacterium]